MLDLDPNADPQHTDWYRDLPCVQVWKDYFPAVDAIVFLIDSCDRARFGESKVMTTSYHEGTV
jgi:hypothetical protein